jgi:hypothetical protein
VYETVASATMKPAAPTTTSQASVSNSDVLMYLVATAIAIITTIAIATVLILRKKQIPSKKTLFLGLVKRPKKLFTRKH